MMCTCIAAHVCAQLMLRQFPMFAQLSMIHETVHGITHQIARDAAATLFEVWLAFKLTESVRNAFKRYFRPLLERLVAICAVYSTGHMSFLQSPFELAEDICIQGLQQKCKF